jgi:hypothetical protein
MLRAELCPLAEHPPYLTFCECFQVRTIARISFNRGMSVSDLLNRETHEVFHRIHSWLARTSVLWEGGFDVL